MKGSSLTWVAACALASMSTGALAAGHASMYLARTPPPRAPVTLHVIPAPAAPSGFAHIPWNWNGHPLAWNNANGFRFRFNSNRFGWNGNGGRLNGGNGQWISALGLGDGGYISSQQDTAPPQIAYVQPAPTILVAPFAVPEGSASLAADRGSSGPLIIYVNRDKSAAQPAGALPKVVYGDTPVRHTNGPEIIYGDSWK